ncbi:hypothetical protein BATDEDRAFT_21856 [Batrachochytrium dendrobatidis JAM81]|uniref:Uncharacterized protein n=1 Tax=Batrachochytrium dendrobatidis (strain JAM81 / FGSC 10211) TaxID=684364 RepID=F4NVL5_BATDJ|nr:uncharacterized protein BATDEDRAFT_21856 [Batrachochytrium dendrobatidis JAM81]EGF83294.1 hypothetical protein BATDEDRAFT_21856 [Batrachochytrium dendrobatidis JAM81]|eukprot:XP_006675399.1 hypothetical protein BATDEDRAFT_21856 [Batrachochytrium dendrobatidis JAM81]
MAMRVYSHAENGGSSGYHFKMSWLTSGSVAILWNENKTYQIQLLFIRNSKNAKSNCQDVDWIKYVVSPVSEPDVRLGKDLSQLAKYFHLQPQYNGFIVQPYSHEMEHYFAVTASILLEDKQC